MSSNKYQNALDKINANIDPVIAQKGSIGSFSVDKNDIYGKCLEAFNKNVEPDITTSEHNMPRVYESAFIEGMWPVILDDNAIESLGDGAFKSCSSLASVNLPACTSIGEEAFEECMYLTSVNFPVCASIASEAFYDCTSLTSLYFTGSSVPSIASNSFFGVPSTATFYVASSMVDAFKSASYWSAFASQIVAYTE